MCIVYPDVTESLSSRHGISDVTSRHLLRQNISGVTVNRFPPVFQRHCYVYISTTLVSPRQLENDLAMTLVYNLVQNLFSEPDDIQIAYEYHNLELSHLTMKLALRERYCTFATDSVHAHYTSIDTVIRVVHTTDGLVHCNKNFSRSPCRGGTCLLVPVEMVRSRHEAAR